jgi:hypothetical protein
MTTISIPEYGTDEQQNETTHIPANMTLITQHFNSKRRFRRSRTAFGNQNSMNSEMYTTNGLRIDLTVTGASGISVPTSWLQAVQVLLHSATQAEHTPTRCSC